MQCQYVTCNVTCIAFNLQRTHTAASNVYIKIADLGISQILSPGGVMGFKGSPGFMAPEILKYVGTEACTEKVDVYSFAMFLFETISLHFPFEKQNLMHAQIEKLVIEGERPPLQSRVRVHCCCCCLFCCGLLHVSLLLL